MAKNKTETPEFLTKYKCIETNNHIAIITFIGGKLRVVEHETGLSEEKDWLERMEYLGYSIEKLETLSAHQKIAMFCEAYKIFFNKQYITKPGDGKKLEPFEITPEILKFYFNVKKDPKTTWWGGEYTIGNFTGNYNTIIRLMSGNGANAAGNNSGAAQGAGGNNNSENPQSMAERIIKNRAAR